MCTAAGQGQHLQSVCGGGERVGGQGCALHGGYVWDRGCVTKAEQGLCGGPGGMVCAKCMCGTSGLATHACRTPLPHRTRVERHMLFGRLSTHTRPCLVERAPYGGGGGCRVLPGVTWAGEPARAQSRSDTLVTALTRSTEPRAQSRNPMQRARSRRPKRRIVLCWIPK